MKLIDNFLNQITMYRLLLYYLLILVVLAVVLGATGVLPYSPVAILVSTLVLIGVTWITNFIFSRVWGVTANVESGYITALILALIISPGLDPKTLLFLAWAAVWSMATKYIMTYNHKHVFNPAAVAVVITAFVLGQSATWWVGTVTMLPFVLIGGLLIVRKIHRFDLVISFTVVALLTISIFSLLRGGSPLISIEKTFLDSSLPFFALVMLTEPLTTPPTRSLRILYGAVTGFLFAPQVHFGSLYMTPELTLIIANIFSFVISPKLRLTLVLEKMEQIGPGLVDFIFRPAQPVSYQPGQFMEWTLGVPKADERGNRRYFTVASSPTEPTLRLGVKFYAPPSRFKEEMLKLKPGDKIIASQLAGDFTLPRDPGKKLVFIAGGIGITPFRSMLKYLADTKQKRDIVLLYSSKMAEELVYTDVFNQAATEAGVSTYYTVTDKTKVPSNWEGHVGPIDQQMISQAAPDFATRMFYISGPRAMILAFEALLSSMGVPGTHIKTDYFPGFA